MEGKLPNIAELFDLIPVDFKSFYKLCETI